MMSFTQTLNYYYSSTLKYCTVVLLTLLERTMNMLVTAESLLCEVSALLATPGGGMDHLSEPLLLPSHPTCHCAHCPP